MFFKNYVIVSHHLSFLFLWWWLFHFIVDLTIFHFSSSQTGILTNKYLIQIGDLWGPLLVCLLLSVILSFTAPGNSGSLVFAAVFVIVWFGAAAVTVNAQLLGGTISFFQSVCILGYCVFPLTLSALACLIARLLVRSVSDLFSTSYFLLL